MPLMTSVEDLRVLHQRRVPRMFYDYAEAGSWTETTLRRNRDAFKGLQLRQRVAVDMSERSLTSSMLGAQWSLPVGLAATGLAGMQHADGEILAAQAAEQFGVPFALSTMSICSLEDVAAHTQKPFWFQLYIMKDRDFVAGLIERAKAARCSALVLTLDLQILGQRYKDLKNGMTAPPRVYVEKYARHGAAATLVCGYAAYAVGATLQTSCGHAKGVDTLDSLSQWSAASNWIQPCVGTMWLGFEIFGAVN